MIRTRSTRPSEGLVTKAKVGIDQALKRPSSRAHQSTLALETTSRNVIQPRSMSEVIQLFVAQLSTTINSIVNLHWASRESKKWTTISRQLRRLFTTRLRGILCPPSPRIRMRKMRLRRLSCGRRAQCSHQKPIIAVHHMRERSQKWHRAPK
jgi:hypothetical protein